MDESQLDALLEDDAVSAALATVLSRAEATDGTVTYAEVRDGVDAQVGGRLLAADVLVGAGDAFVVEDPVALRTALEARGHDVTAAAAADASVDETDDAAGWRPVDRVAGVCALVMAAGYQVSAIKSPLVGAIDTVLGPAAAVVPFPILVLGLAFGTATVSTVLRRRLVDTDAIDRQKERLQTVKERLQAARDRDDRATVERLEAEQRDLARQQLGAITRSLRPMAWSMLVTIPVFLWLSWLVVSPSAAIAHVTPFLPMLDRIVWTTRVVGPMQLWMVWYVACQLTSTLLLRRGLDRLEGRDALPV